MLDRYQGDDVQPLYTGRVRVSGGQAQHGRASGAVSYTHLTLPTILLV